MKDTMDTFTAKWKAVSLGNRILLLVAIVTAGIIGFTVYQKVIAVKPSLVEAER